MTEDNFETARFDEAIRSKLGQHSVNADDAAWNRLHSRLQTEMPPSLIVNRNTQLLRYAVAATLIAATLTFSLWKTSSTFDDKQAPVANKQQLQLNTSSPDASAITETSTNSSVKQVIEPTPSAPQQATLQLEKHNTAIPSLQEKSDNNSLANENYTPVNTSSIHEEVPAIPIKILREEPKQPLDNIEVIEKKVDPKKRKGKK